MNIKFFPFPIPPPDSHPAVWADTIPNLLAKGTVLADVEVWKESPGTVAVPCLLSGVVTSVALTGRFEVMVEVQNWKLEPKR